jgi:acyl-CoA-binding protein
MRDEFDHVVARVRALGDGDGSSRGPSTGERLRLYALFKQATKGDLGGSVPTPSVFDIAGRAKHNAWKACRGMNTDMSMREYVQTVEQLMGATAGNVEPLPVQAKENEKGEFVSQLRTQIVHSNADSHQQYSLAAFQRIWMPVARSTDNQLLDIARFVCVWCVFYNHAWVLGGSNSRTTVSPILFGNHFVMSTLFFISGFLHDHRTIRRAVWKLLVLLVSIWCLNMLACVIQSVELSAWRVQQQGWCVLHTLHAHHHAYCRASFVVV